MNSLTSKCILNPKMSAWNVPCAGTSMSMMRRLPRKGGLKRDTAPITSGYTSLSSCANNPHSHIFHDRVERYGAVCRAAVTPTDGPKAWLPGLCVGEEQLSSLCPG